MGRKTAKVVFQRFKMAAAKRPLDGIEGGYYTLVRYPWP
jgi:hypothetical protein